MIAKLWIGNGAKLSKRWLFYCYHTTILDLIADRKKKLWKSSTYNFLILSLVTLAKVKKNFNIVRNGNSSYTELGSMLWNASVT